MNVWQFQWGFLGRTSVEKASTSRSRSEDAQNTHVALNLEKRNCGQNYGCSYLGGRLSRGRPAEAAAGATSTKDRNLRERRHHVQRAADLFRRGSRSLDRRGERASVSSMHSLRIVILASSTSISYISQFIYMNKFFIRGSSLYDSAT